METQSYAAQKVEFCNQTHNTSYFLEGPNCIEFKELQICVKIFLLCIGEKNEIPQTEIARAMDLKKSVFKLYTPEYIQQLEKFNPIEVERLEVIQTLLHKSAPSDAFLNMFATSLKEKIQEAETLLRMKEKGASLKSTLQYFASLTKEFDESSLDLLVARYQLFEKKRNLINKDEDLNEKGKFKRFASLIEEFRKDITPLMRNEPSFTKEALEENVKSIQKEAEQLTNVNRNGNDNIVRSGVVFSKLGFIKEKEKSFESLIRYLYGTPDNEEDAQTLFNESSDAIRLLLSQDEEIVKKHKRSDCNMM